MRHAAAAAFRRLPAGAVASGIVFSSKLHYGQRNRGHDRPHFDPFKPVDPHEVSFVSEFDDAPDEMDATAEVVEAVNPPIESSELPKEDVPEVDATTSTFNRSPALERLMQKARAKRMESTPPHVGGAGGEEAVSTEVENEPTQPARGSDDGRLETVQDFMESLLKESVGAAEQRVEGDAPKKRMKKLKKRKKSAESTNADDADAAAVDDATWRSLNFMAATYCTAAAAKTFSLESSNVVGNDDVLKKARQFPAFMQREEMVRTIEQHDVSIVQGSTGSGKSSLVPLLVAAAHRATFVNDLKTAFPAAVYGLQNPAPPEPAPPKLPHEEEVPLQPNPVAAFISAEQGGLPSRSEFLQQCPEASEILNQFHDASVFANRARLRMFVTQPTRFACKALADYTRKMTENLAIRPSIGYAVAGDVQFNDATEIIFVTPAYLLNYLLHQELREAGVERHRQHPNGNSALDLPTHLIIDEAHCRDLDSDLLMVWARLHLLQRFANHGVADDESFIAGASSSAYGKLVVMSATLDANRLMRYFDTPPTSVVKLRTATDAEMERSTERRFAHGGMLSSGKHTCQYFFSDGLKNFPLTQLARHSGKKMDNTPEDERLLATIENGFRSSSDKVREEIPFGLFVNVGALIRRLLAPHQNIVVFVPGYADMMKVVAALKDQLHAGNDRSGESGDRAIGSMAMLEEDGLAGAGNGEPALSLRHRGREVDVVLLHSTALGESTHQLRGSKAPCKIIIATNVAESSVTLPEVKYVIDFATERYSTADAVTGLHTLATRYTAQSNMAQRRGRTGRTCNGYAIHLLPTKVASRLPAFNPPQSTREGGEALVLRVKRLFAHQSFSTVVSQLLDRPDRDDLLASLQDLESRSLVTSNECLEESQLTDRGFFVASMPLDVQLSSFLLSAMHLDVLPDAIMIAAALNVFSIYNQRTQMDKIFESFMAQTRSKLDAAGVDADADTSELWGLRNMLRRWYNPATNARALVQQHNLSHAFLKTVDMHVRTLCGRIIAMLVVAGPQASAARVASSAVERDGYNAAQAAETVPEDHPWFGTIRELTKLKRLAEARGADQRTRKQIRAEWVPALETSGGVRMRLLTAFVSAFLDNLMVGFPQQNKRFNAALRLGGSGSETERSRMCIVPVGLEARDGEDVDKRLLRAHLTDEVLQRDVVPRLATVGVTSVQLVGDGTAMSVEFGTESKSETEVPPSGGSARNMNDVTRFLKPAPVAAASPWGSLRRPGATEAAKSAPAAADGNGLLAIKPLTMSPELLRNTPHGEDAKEERDGPLPLLVRPHIGILGTAFASSFVLKNLKVNLPASLSRRYDEYLASLDEAEQCSSTDTGAEDAPVSEVEETLALNESAEEADTAAGTESKPVIPTTSRSIMARPRQGIPVEILREHRDRLERSRGNTIPAYLSASPPLFAGSLRWVSLMTVSRKAKREDSSSENEGDRKPVLSGSASQEGFCPFCLRLFADEKQLQAHYASPGHASAVRSFKERDIDAATIFRVFGSFSHSPDANGKKKRKPASKQDRASGDKSATPSDDRSADSSQRAPQLPSRSMFFVSGPPSNPFGLPVLNPALRGSPLRHVQPLMLPARLATVNRNMLSCSGVWPLDLNADFVAILFGVVMACSRRYPISILTDKRHSKVVALQVVGWFSLRLPVELDARQLRILFAASREQRRSSRDNCLSPSRMGLLQNRFASMARQREVSGMGKSSTGFVGSSESNEDLHWCSLTPEVDACVLGDAKRNSNEIDSVEAAVLLTLQDAILARRRVETLEAFVSRLSKRIDAIVGETTESSRETSFHRIAAYLKARRFSTLQTLLESLGCVFFPRGTSVDMKKSSQVLVFYVPAALPDSVPSADFLPQLLQTTVASTA